jgi:hypothetical protein
VSTDLDRLELELRSIPGVVFVGLDRDAEALLVQAVVVASAAAKELRARVRKVVSANVREQVSLEIVVDHVSLPTVADTAAS